jgi:hypothetical protein
VEGAVVVFVRSFGRVKVWVWADLYLGKKATMKIARKIRVFLRFVSKGIWYRRRRVFELTSQVVGLFNVVEL